MASPPVKNARWAEIVELLGSHKSDPLPAWVGLALDQPEILHIEVDQRIPGTSMRPRFSKVDEIGRGVDVSHVDVVTLQRWGPGDYRFAAVAPCPTNDNRPNYCGQVFVPLGEPREIAAADRTGSMVAPAAGAAAADGDGASARKVMNDMLKERLERSSMRAAIREEETAGERERLDPMKLAVEMAKMFHPADGGTNKVLELFIAQNAQLMNALLTRSAPAADAAGGLSGVDSLLGLVQKVRVLFGEGGPGPEAPPRTSFWDVMPQVVNSPVVKEAVGAFRDGLDLMKVKLTGVPAVPRPVAVETPGAIAAGEGKPMATAELPPFIKDMADLAFHALKDKDWPTVEFAYERVRAQTGAMLGELDPDVNPAGYVYTFKAFDPRFEAEWVPAHFRLFLEWIREQDVLAAAPAPVPGAPA